MLIERRDHNIRKVCAIGKTYKIVNGPSTETMFRHFMKKQFIFFTIQITNDPNGKNTMPLEILAAYIGYNQLPASKTDDWIISAPGLSIFYNPVTKTGHLRLLPWAHQSLSFDGDFLIFILKQIKIASTYLRESIL